MGTIRLGRVFSPLCHIRRLLLRLVKFTRFCLKTLFVFHNCMQEAAPLLACRLSLCCCVRGESRNRSPHTVFCSWLHLSLKFLILFAYKKSKLCLMRRPFTKNTHFLLLNVYFRQPKQFVSIGNLGTLKWLFRINPQEPFFSPGHILISTDNFWCMLSPLNL